MKTQTSTERRTQPEERSDLYQMWARTLFSTWQVPGASDRKPAEPSASASAM